MQKDNSRGLKKIRIFTQIRVTFLKVNYNKYVRLSFSNKIAYDCEFRKIFEN